MSDRKTLTQGSYAYAYADQKAYIKQDNDQAWTPLHGPTPNATIRSTTFGVERAYEGPF